MIKVKFSDVCTAVLLCAVIVASSVLCANALTGSRFYRQSRIVSLLVRQERMDLSGLLFDSRGARMVYKFAGALTAAYINFEFIPLNEASTFMVIFESMPDGIEVDGFAYHRKNLEITGEAPSRAAVDEFTGALDKSGAFASVTGSGYDSTSGGFKFSIECVSVDLSPAMPFTG